MLKVPVSFNQPIYQLRYPMTSGVGVVMGSCIGVNKDSV